MMVAKRRAAHPRERVFKVGEGYLRKKEVQNKP